MSQEIIKLVDDAISEARTLFGKIFGPVADEFGLMLADNLKIRRLKNQIANLSKIEKIISEHKITPQQINLKVLVPYLENVSLEEDDKLQDMWANLMVNYLDPNKNLLTHVYPQILTQLSTIEVKLLNFNFTNGPTNYRNQIEDIQFPFLYSSNLIRLGLIDEIVSYTAPGVGRLEGTNNVFVHKNQHFELSKFGKNFVEACKPIELSH